MTRVYFQFRKIDNYTGMERQANTDLRRLLVSYSNIANYHK